MPPPVLRCGKGQHEAKRIPCERTRAPTLAPKCVEAGKPAQRRAVDAQMGLKRVPRAKPYELLSAP